MTTNIERAFTIMMHDLQAHDRAWSDAATFVDQSWHPFVELVYGTVDKFGRMDDQAREKFIADASAMISTLRTSAAHANLIAPPRAHGRATPRAQVSGAGGAGARIGAPIVTPIDVTSDLIAQVNAYDAQWTPIRAFLANEWQPFVQMIGVMTRSWQGQPADLQRFLSSQAARADALIERGLRYGLRPVGRGTLAVRGDLTMNRNRNRSNASVGRNTSYPQGELALCGAIAEPSAVSITLDVDHERILHAVMCINGTCYRSAVNLDPLLEQLGVYMADYHRHLHESMADHVLPPAPEDSPPIAVAGSLMLGQAVERHALTMSAGWMSSLKKFAGKTLHKLKGPIAAAAGIAAGAAAAAIPGGALVAPIATNLAHSIVHAATGSGSVKAVAEQAVAAAQEAAKTDPTMAKVVDEAHKAVAQATATYHIAQTVSDAADGDTAAAGKLVDLATSANAGDPAAKTALDIANQVADSGAATPGSPGSGSGSSGLGAGAATVSGLDPFTSKSKLRAHDYVMRRAAGGKTGVVGYVHLMTGERYVIPFPSADHADDWFGRLEPGTFVYAAYFDPHDQTFPGALNEKVWTPAGVVGGSIDVAPDDPIFVDVPVMDEDGTPTGDAVAWPTRLSASPAGNVPPCGWIAPELDSHGGNLFVWLDGKGNTLRTYTPTWKPHRHRARVHASAVASGFPLGVLALGVGMGAGSVYGARAIEKWWQNRRPHTNAPESHQSPSSPMNAMAQGAAAGIGPAGAPGKAA